MFFIPLSQIESVELVIHALRAAGGQADCTACPAYRVCMKQCLTIADTVSRMARQGTLPVIDEDESPEPPSSGGGGPGRPAKGGLKVVK
ncbi:hypothetical protein [Trichloromonas acetexigens]|jgi:hypothetical protein|uniref:Uncharacterized protein n=1 Tax=Trichloromonas acetexigens TaxID=38815 RepID=A0A550JG85_9BACT|nr:hypothetical protein [Desulfuromonas acetexigens]TRO82222.1 hypothetical protein FL622_06495 [Desulfuromonas acetexigens]